MTYSAAVPTARRKGLGRFGVCIQARLGRPAANIKNRPVTKRPNAIHVGSMANLIVCGPHDKIVCGPHDKHF